MSISKLQVTLLLPFIFALNAFAQPTINTYINEARGEISAKNYFDAIQNLDICIKLKPSEYEAYFLRGICKYFLNDNIGAEQDLNVAINIYDPYLYEAFHYRSFVKYRLGKYDEAIMDINEVIGAEGNKPALYIERAFSKLANQDYNGSLNDCNFALNKGIISENIYLCKGMAENALTQFDSALKDYNKALNINPKNEDIYVRIGITHAGMGNYNAAIEQYNKALKIDTGCTLAYYNRAEANIKINNAKGALDDYNKVIKYDPTNELAYYNRAILKADKNDYADAISNFDQVLILNPKNIQALFNRAKLKTAIKDYRGALADYTKTIEIFPYYTEAYYYRAQLKESLHDYTGAKVDYNMGKVMSEVSNSGNSLQRANDSNTLSHLSALHANFSNANEKPSDTINIDILPIYYMTLKNNTRAKPGYFPVLLKKSKKEYNSYWLTNKMIHNNVTDSNLNSLNEVAKDSDMTPEELLQKAIQKTNLQLFNDAIKDYDKIIKRDTGFALAYFARGVDLCGEIEILNKFNENEQYTLINKTYHVVTDPKSEKYKKALSDFNEAILMEPDFTYAYYNRAYVKYKLQDYKGAVEDYNHIIRIDPDFAEAYYNRGLLLFRLRDNLNACQDFSKAGELGLTEAYIVIKQYCTQINK